MPLIVTNFTLLPLGIKLGISILLRLFLSITIVFSLSILGGVTVSSDGGVTGGTITFLSLTSMSTAFINELPSENLNEIV